MPSRRPYIPRGGVGDPLAGRNFDDVARQLSEIQDAPISKGVLGFPPLIVSEARTLSPDSPIVIYSGRGSETLALPPASAAGEGVALVLNVANRGSGAVRLHSKEMADRVPYVTVHKAGVATCVSDGRSRWWVQSEGGEREIYLRPASILLNDKTDLGGWDANKSIRTKAGVSLKLAWEVPRYVKAVRRVSAWISLADNSQAAGASFTLSLRRMVSFTGNTSEAPLTELTVTHVASNTTTAERLVQTPEGLVLMDDPSRGLGELQLYMEFNSPTAWSTVKEVRLEVIA